MKLFFCSLWLITLPTISTAVPLSDFFGGVGNYCNSSGRSADDILRRSDCDAILFPEEINYEILFNLDIRFPFFNDSVRTINTNINGFLSFNGMVRGSSFPIPFPITGITIVATFWNYIDVRGDRGNVVLRPSTDPTQLNKASREIRQHFVDMSSFNATWIFVVSWNKVAYFLMGDLNNTFQIVLVTDGVHSFAINNYKDDGINWSSVEPLGLGNGSTGTAAQAGFNDGYGINYFLVPGSNTLDIINISSTSNVGIPGKWIFRFTYPSLIISPQFLLQQLGGVFMLNCTPSDNTSEIGWLRNDDTLIIDNARLSYLPNDKLRHILYISNASHEDDGNYTCALNRSGTLIDPQISQVTIFRDIVNIFNEDGDQLVANAIVNSFSYIGSGGSASGAGIPIMLRFTCVTVNGHENATWENPVNIGTDSITYDDSTLYMSSVEVLITSDNFTVLLNCSSADSQQFSTLTITSETPYIRVLGNSSILATVGSRPVLEFTVAVDSDGVLEFQNNVTSLLTFTFTNSSQNQTLLPLPVLDPNNFQRYSYTLPPLGVGTEGIYTLTFNGTQGEFASESVIIRLDVPQINLAPSLVIQQFGSRITLNCTPSNNTIPVFWLRNGQPLANVTFLPNLTLKHLLIIDSASMSDSGIYSCGLNMTGLPTNEQFSDVILYRDSINILNSGNYVENNSVINQFINNGTNPTLTLTCVTIDGLGGSSWSMLSQSGNAIVSVNNMSDMFNTNNTLMLSNPTSDYATHFSCRSHNNNTLYKEVFVTSVNPYYNLLSNNSIFAPVASSPIIRIVIAINSNGTIDQQRETTDSLTFTHTSNGVMTTVEGLEPDPLNFQLYEYIFPPLRRSSEGDYRIQSAITVNGRSLDVLIELEVDITELELTRSFASVILLEGNSVTISCTPNITEAVLYWVYNDNGTNITESTGRIRLFPTGINHNLTIVNPVMSDSGIYFCRSVIEEQLVQESINVTIVPACQSNFSRALFWMNSRRGTEVIQSCSELHSSFRFGVSISRHCQADGSWSPVDIRNCTMSRDSNPVIIVYFTTSQNNRVEPNNILNLITTSYAILNPEIRTYDHGSDSGEELHSVTISFNLQERIAPVGIVESITSILRNNNSLNGEFQVLAFQPSLNCTCDINTEISNTLQIVCTGPSIAPCICGENTCECNEPAFVGNDTICGLDSDSDGFPDVGLSCDEPACQRDLCPDIYSVIGDIQSGSFCAPPDEIPDDNRCPFEQDLTWNITWPATNVSSVAIQKCPGGSEAEGFAQRACNGDGEWGTPNVSQCQTVEQIRLRMRAEELSDLVENVFTSEDRDLTQTFEPEVIVDITEDLEDITNTSAPILPNDVTSASETLNLVLLATEIAGEEVDETATMEVVMGAINVLDSLFDERNDVSFEEMSVESEGTEQSAGELLLANTERVGVLFSTTVNASANETVRSYLEGSNNNVVIEAQIPTEEDLMEIGNVRFPPPAGDENAVRFNNMTPTIEIPTDIVLQRIGIEGRRVPIINSVSRNRNLPAGRSTIASMTLSSQISTSLDPIFFEEGQTVTLVFNIENVVGNDSLTPRCAFFNLTTRNFSENGIVQLRNNGTHIQCTSAHLTSFAVLVDASGGAASAESEALSYISYIGCGISIVCLATTIIIMIVLRTKVFNQVQHFVHINLAVALLLGLIAFVAGIEHANEYRESCLAVAVLLHYLFMAAFCWMLCEGIILFIILHFVFYKGFFNSRKFYLLVGWGLPIPIVAISAGIAHDKYGINDRCWLSEEEGTIWAFIGPMLLIILINTCFLIATLYRIYKSKRSNMTAEEATIFDTAKSLLKASFVLMPVLGVTWVFGLLIINEDTVAFVWVFTILNSLQGLFIMILYVFRNDKFIKLIKTCGKGRTLTYTTSAKGTLKSSSLSSHYVDRDTVKKSLSSYNRVIREKYVNPDSYVAVENENAEQTFSPTNVFNARGAADEFTFNEQDELEQSSSWHPPRSDSVLESVTPSEYLRHQKQAVIGYVDVNIFVEEETHL